MKKNQQIIEKLKKVLKKELNAQEISQLKKIYFREKIEILEEFLKKEKLN